MLSGRTPTLEKKTDPSVASVDEITKYLGTLLAGRYRIDRPFASGTMGRVFEGMQLPLERPVAIKVLRSTGQFADVRFKKRFCREASIAAQLQHPNIVSVYDYGETDDGELFMVMELLSGRSLLDAMLDEGPFSPERTLDIAMQVTRALRKAHHEGVVHRDLKPANIIVRRDEDGVDFVKVLDFGLVKIFAPEETHVSAPYVDDHLTRAGCMVGTPEYVSPEQALGEAVDGRTDIYSLGVLMFQMIAGRVPFTGSTLMEIIHQHFSTDVPNLKDVAPSVDCPFDLERIIRKCMGKVVEERYRSVDELLGEMKTLWRVLMDESCGTEPSIQLLDFELRQSLPIGLREATLSVRSSFDAVTIKPPEMPPIPPEGAVHLDPSDVPLAEVTRIVHRAPRTSVLFWAGIATFVLSVAFSVMWVVAGATPSRTAAVVPAVEVEAAPEPPALKAEVEREIQTEKETEVVEKKADAPAHKTKRPVRTKGYKENPF